MDRATSIARVGQAVRVIAEPHMAGHPPVGTSGIVAAIGKHGVPNPVQVRFDNADHTLRHYSETQFAMCFALVP